MMAKINNKCFFVEFSKNMTKFLYNRRLIMYNIHCKEK